MARTSSGGRVTKASGRRPPLTRGRRAAPDKRSSASSANGREEPLVVFFDDIRLVRDLLGDYDANLAVLEDRLGIREQVIFPEIDYDSIKEIRGLDVAITTSAQTDEQAEALLRGLGLPIATEEQES